MTEAATTAGAAPEFDPGPARGVRWDLSDLYVSPDDPRLEADLATGLERAKRFAAAHRGRVAGYGAAELAAILDDYEAMQEPVSRAGAYAGLVFAADTSVPRHGALLQRVQEQGSAIRSELLFFDLEWVAVEDRAAEALLADAALAKRRHLLGAMRRYRPHLKSEVEERLLEETSNTGSRAFGRLFDEVMADARFTIERDGRTASVGEEEALGLLHDADREVRRGAAASVTQGLRERSRVLAFIFNTLAQDKSFEDRLRGYADPMDARNLANEIDGPAVRALLAACEARYPLVQRYYRLKASLLGLPQLADYDRYAPLPEAAGERSFDGARALVLESYADFARPMADIAERFFSARWIDAELRAGKRGGAFSASTVPSVHPYVMLNYTGNLRDVMTIAHELGHGVHQWLARERGLFEQDSPLTTAETASVFGEMLVFRRLMREERDPAVRLALLCGKLEDAFATVFRQVAMTRFEQGMHAARRAEGELAVPRVNEIWLAANRAMFGESVELTADYGLWWLYIPHFVHTPFYCYAYAFGELLVLALLRRYDDQGAAFVPQYLELLAAGGSAPPPELLARVGLDIQDPKFWDGGLAVLESMVTEAEQLAAGLRS